MFSRHYDAYQIRAPQQRREEGFRLDSFKESHLKRGLNTDLFYQRSKELQEMTATNGKQPHISQLGSKQAFVPGTHFLHKYPEDLNDLSYSQRLYHLRHQDYFKHHDQSTNQPSITALDHRSYPYSKKYHDLGQTVGSNRDFRSYQFFKGHSDSCFPYNKHFYKTVVPSKVIKRQHDHTHNNVQNNVHDNVNSSSSCFNKSNNGQVYNNDGVREKYFRKNDFQIAHEMPLDPRAVDLDADDAMLIQDKKEIRKRDLNHLGAQYIDLFIPVDLQVTGLEEFIFGCLMIGTEGIRPLIGIRKQLALKPEFDLRTLWRRYIDKRRIGKAGIVQISYGIAEMLFQHDLIDSQEQERIRLQTGLEILKDYNKIAIQSQGVLNLDQFQEICFGNSMTLENRFYQVNDQIKYTDALQQIEIQRDLFSIARPETVTKAQSKVLTNLDRSLHLFHQLINAVIDYHMLLKKLLSQMVNRNKVDFDETFNTIFYNFSSFSRKYEESDKEVKDQEYLSLRQADKKVFNEEWHQFLLNGSAQSTSGKEMGFLTYEESLEIFDVLDYQDKGFLNGFDFEEVKRRFSKH